MRESRRRRGRHPDDLPERLSRLRQKGSRPEKPQNWLIAIAPQRLPAAVPPVLRRAGRGRPSRTTSPTRSATTPLPTGDDIRRALGHLAFNQRAALVMRELEGRSYAEIAEVLEVSTSAVETLIFRARRALREQLEGSITCGEAEFAISRQLDGRLPRQERGQLRAHLRECLGVRRLRSSASEPSEARSRRFASFQCPALLMSLFGGRRRCRRGNQPRAQGGGSAHGRRRHRRRFDTRRSSRTLACAPNAAKPAQQVQSRRPPRQVSPATAGAVHGAPAFAVEAATTRGAAGKAGGERTRTQARKLKTHGKGAQKVHHRRRRGVAARHVKTVRATHPAHPVRRHVPQTKAKHSPKSKAHLPAGPTRRQTDRRVGAAAATATARATASSAARSARLDTLPHA